MFVVIFAMSAKLIEFDLLNPFTHRVEDFYFWSKGGDSMKNKVSGYTHSKNQINNYSNQNNKNNKAYIANLNNRANQLNPNNDKYYSSRLKNK